jgi:hypothetical protein
MNADNQIEGFNPQTVIIFAAKQHKERNVNPGALRVRPP